MPWNHHKWLPYQILGGKTVNKVQNNGDMDEKAKHLGVSKWEIKRCNEWRSECGSEWVSEWMSECMSEWMTVWVSAWVSEWLCEWVHEWVNDCVIECMNELMREWVTEWGSEWVFERHPSTNKLRLYSNCLRIWTQENMVLNLNECQQSTQTFLRHSDLKM